MEKAVQNAIGAASGTTPMKLPKGMPPPSEWAAKVPLEQTPAFKKELGKMVTEKLREIFKARAEQVKNTRRQRLKYISDTIKKRHRTSVGDLVRTLHHHKTPFPQPEGKGKAKAKGKHVLKTLKHTLKQAKKGLGHTLPGLGKHLKKLNKLSKKDTQLVAALVVEARSELLHKMALENLEEKAVSQKEVEPMPQDEHHSERMPPQLKATRAAPHTWAMKVAGDIQREDRALSVTPDSVVPEA